MKKFSVDINTFTFIDNIISLSMVRNIDMEVSRKICVNSNVIGIFFADMDLTCRR